tara:strand:+ start:2946 stop:3662 length:717 start_codon:yes stop_codon:yes gene_type:complete
MNFPKKFKIKIFADGADIKDLKKNSKNKLISGFTTNPSLIRKSGEKNYLSFSKKITTIEKKKSISLEIFANDQQEIIRQARTLAKIAKNVYVKIPITNDKGLFLGRIIKKLQIENIKLNITAIFTEQQIDNLKKVIDPKKDIILSLFCGRIADTGINPQKIVRYTKKKFKNKKKVKILWASTREIYNIIEANNSGADIITVPYSILKKLNLFNYNLKSYSLKTVKEFSEDAKKSKFKI